MSLVEIKDLKIHFNLSQGLLKAVDGVNLKIERGKTLGIVGESGSGKSLTSKAILRLNPEDKFCTTTGEVFFNDIDSETGEVKETVEINSFKNNFDEKILNIRGNKIAMIFQEPMTAFASMYTIGDQISEILLTHRTNDKEEAKRITIDMLKKVGIAEPEKRFSQYPHEFSGGMRQRAMIAMALACEPELLIADEPTTALDVTIQAQVLELMEGLQKEMGMAILFITHDLGIIADISDEVAVMYLGRVVEQAPVEEIFYNPKHPYTIGLLQSIPNIAQKKEKLESIRGNVPMAIDLPLGCGFQDRCDSFIDGVCNAGDINEIFVSDDHMVRCVLYDESLNLSDEQLQKGGDTLGG